MHAFRIGDNIQLYYTFLYISDRKEKKKKRKPYEEDDVSIYAEREKVSRTQLLEFHTVLKG